MSTFYVSKSGNDSNNGATSGTAKLTIGAAVGLAVAAVGAGIGTNVITVGDGTYTETITYSLSNLTIKSTSSDRTAVIITQSSGDTFLLAKGTTGNVFQHLTIQNTDADATDNGIYGANGGSGSHASFTVEDCIFDCQSAAVNYSYGSKFRRTKFLVNGGDDGSNVYAIRNGTGADGATQDIESCLFVGWDKQTVTGTSHTIIRNCTFILDASTQSTSYIVYLGGTNNEIYNSIAYGGATSVDFGFRIHSAGSTQKMKNLISFGATGTAFSGNSGDTVVAQLEDNGDVTTDGNAIFTSIGSAGITDDYTINADGLAYGRGLAAELPSHGNDVDGNAFDSSSPNIGCYATVASGWTAGTCAGVAHGNITSVDGVAKSSIASINGV